jgi:DNA-binding FrmR family transcriptional regulator
MKLIQNRIRRVRGQMLSLENAMSTGQNCDTIIPQLLAVKGSVDSLVRAYLEATLQECTKSSNVEAIQKVTKFLISRT